MRYNIDIGGLIRELPIVSINDDTSIAFMNIVGDTELIIQASKELCKMIPPSTDYIIAPETGGIILAHQISVDSGIPYIAVRKKLKPFMTNPISMPVKTIATKFEQVLCIGEVEASLIKGKNILFVDEVISSGNTLRTTENIILKAMGNIIGKICIATEGEKIEGVQSLCHIPFFKNENN